MTQEPTTAWSVAPAAAMTAEQRAAFERDGYLIIRDTLCPDEVAGARDAVDRVYAARTTAGSHGPDGSMHLLSAVANCPELAFLTGHPATFGCVWSTLGWNIHVHHSHLDVHPPVRVPEPFRFEWHQGRRQAEPRDRDEPARACR
jgi:ectoine hydroxylase